ncbi:hypothetical protein KN815_49535, partial [Streptomyces sp. 4503]
ADETGLPRGLRLRLGLLRLKLGLRLVLGLALALGLTLALRLALALGLCLVGRRQFRRLGQRAAGAATSGGREVLRLAAAGVLAPVGLLFLGRTGGGQRGHARFDRLGGPLGRVGGGSGQGEGRPTARAL